MGAMKEASVAARAQGQQIESIGTSLQSFASATMTSLASFGAGKWLLDVAQSAMEAEHAIDSLTAVISVNSSAVTETLQSYKDFADTLSGVTLLTKGTTYSLLQHAEMMGKTGTAAQQLVINAEALAAATGRSVEQGMRAAEAMEEGNVHMLRFALGMRGVKDDTEVLARAQRMLAAGWEMTTKESASAGGQLKHLQNDLKALGTDFGKLAIEVLKPVIQALRDLIAWVKNLPVGVKTAIITVVAMAGAVAGLVTIFKILAMVMSPTLVIFGILGAALGVWVNQVGGFAKAWAMVRDALVGWLYANKELVVSLGLVAAAVAGVYTAYRILVFTITAVRGALVALGVVRALEILGWIAYRIVVGTVQLAMAAFTFAIGLAQTAMTVFTSTAIIAGTLAIAKMIIGFTALAAIVTFIGIRIAGILYGLLASVSGLSDAFSRLSKVEGGPLEEIGGIFREWFGMIGDIVDAVQYDMPQAWEIAKAAFAVAVEEIKLLWEPLWEFIQTGFAATWKYISDLIAMETGKAAGEALKKAGGMMGSFLKSLGLPVDEALKKVDEAQKLIDRGMGSASKNFAKTIADAAEYFALRVEFAPTEGVEQAQRIYKERVRELFDIYDERMMQELDEIENQAKLKAKVPSIADLGRHLVDLKAVLAGSSEAQRRIAEFQYKMTTETRPQDVNIDKDTKALLQRIADNTTPGVKPKEAWEVELADLELE
jgi:hypothetical protein